MKHKDLLLPLQ